MAAMSILLMTSCSILNPNLVGSIGTYTDDDFPYIDCKKSGENYVFSFQDDNISQGETGMEYDFTVSAESFEKLYGNLVNGFEQPPAEDLKVETLKDYVVVEFQKTLGIVNCRFVWSRKEHSLGVAYSTWISKRELNKLFGK